MDKTVSETRADMRDLACATAKGASLTIIDCAATMRAISFHWELFDIAPASAKPAGGVLGLAAPGAV